MFGDNFVDPSSQYGAIEASGKQDSQRRWIDLVARWHWDIFHAEPERGFKELSQFANHK